MSSSGKAFHIVSVDDEPEIGGLIKRYFEKHGLPVSTVTSADQFWALAAKRPVDLALLDVNMPGEDGVSIARQLRAKGNCGIIFLTANTAGALPLFSQMLPEAGLSTDTIQYMGLSRWDTPPQTLELPGVQGGWFALPDPGRSAQFQNRSGAFVPQ